MQQLNFRPELWQVMGRAPYVGESITYGSEEQFVQLDGSVIYYSIYPASVVVPVATISKPFVRRFFTSGEWVVTHFWPDGDTGSCLTVRRKAPQPR
jgi:hypothetical protein